MEPIPLSGQMIWPEGKDAPLFAAEPPFPAAALTDSPRTCALADTLANAGVPAGLVLNCVPGPGEVSAACLRPTEALIAEYKAVLRQGIPLETSFLYLRGTDSFASLRCAVLAVTDLTGRTIMAEVPVKHEGMMADGTDVVAAVGVLQRIGVSTILLSGDTAQDVSDALAKAAPYARVSLGARIDPDWLGDAAHPFPNAELFLPRHAQDAFALWTALQTYIPAKPLPRDHDDFMLAPDGTNPHFLDPFIDISDEIEIEGRLSERLLEAEDEAGALKLQFECEEDLVSFEEQVFMLARPVCLCAEQPELLEAALRIYPGRALYDGTWPLDEPVSKYFSEKYGMIVL